MKTLAERLKSCRDAKGVTQSAAAKAAGMSQTNLSELESDLYPTSSFVPVLADYYGVNALWLATGKGRRDDLGNLVELNPEEIAWLALREKLGEQDRAFIFKIGDSLAKPSDVTPHKGKQ